MTESPSETASSNRLLAMLPRATTQRILPSMVRVGLPLQTRLLASGLAHDAIYFPLDALVVLTHTDEHARTAGVAFTGCDGVVGAGLLLGSRVSINDASVVME